MDLQLWLYLCSCRWLWSHHHFFPSMKTTQKSPLKIYFYFFSVYLISIYLSIYYYVCSFQLFFFLDKEMNVDGKKQKSFFSYSFLIVSHSVVHWCNDDLQFFFLCKWISTWQSIEYGVAKKFFFFVILHQHLYHITLLMITIRSYFFFAVCWVWIKSFLDEFKMFIITYVYSIQILCVCVCECIID